MNQTSVSLFFPCFDNLQTNSTEMNGERLFSVSEISKNYLIGFFWYDVWTNTISCNVCKATKYVIVIGFSRPNSIVRHEYPYNFEMFKFK